MQHRIFVVAAGAAVLALALTALHAQAPRKVLIAHRGASGHAPENTLPAFELAVKQGADAFELDVRLTRDGAPVVIHDPTLDRTTDLAGPVGARTFAELRAADARQTAAWWDGRPFDAVLLDAPCTASGIVRRHPDVRWLRRPDDIHALARIQSEMLDALWPLLAPGGRLLYATCSIFPAEGQQQIDAFMQRLGPGRCRLDPASPGHLLPSRDNGWQGEPGRGTALQDGFFYALIHKT